MAAIVALNQSHSRNPPAGCLEDYAELTFCLREFGIFHLVLEQQVTTRIFA